MCDINLTLFQNWGYPWTQRKTGASMGYSQQDAPFVQEWGSFSDKPTWEGFYSVGPRVLDSHPFPCRHIDGNKPKVGTQPTAKTDEICIYIYHYIIYIIYNIICNIIYNIIYNYIYNTVLYIILYIIINIII
jgi:hypothetical protein